MIFNNIKQFLTLIRFSHTVFALPFALISTVLALRATDQLGFYSETYQIVLWIILAMVGARSGAMGFNRLVDRKFDRDNPRTANRPSVTGAISGPQMIVFIILSFALLVFSAWKLNYLAFYLSPVAILLLCFYSFTKRFTSFSHLFLGLAIGTAPIAAWIAVAATISATSITLGISVLAWIAGFDILYALQDLDYDKSVQLRSIPVKIGIPKSLLAARILHLISVLCWLTVYKIENLNIIFLIGVILSTGLLIWEHSLLKKDDLSKLNVAFFNMNAIISVTIFFALIFDLFFFFT